MGENQGMIWIILGVLVVAAAVIFLGGTMGDNMRVSEAHTAAQAAMTDEQCQAINDDPEFAEIGVFTPSTDGNGDYVGCEFEKN